MVRRGETTLWTCPLGIRCVLLTYDETRYQLKLVRELGTIKADLFAAVVMILVGVPALAGPARRAIRIDPAEALRMN